MADAHRRAAAVLDDARERARALIGEAQIVVEAATGTTTAPSRRTAWEDKVNGG